MAILANTLILHKAIFEKNSIINIFLTLFAVILEQSAKINFKTNLINKLNILIYLVCLTILTKCFTSILLNTYFIKRETFTANTFQDIIDKPGISVAGRYSLRLIRSTKPEAYEKLFHRVIDYENSLKISDNDLIFDLLLNPIFGEDIINRKAVAILGTREAEYLKNLYPDSKIMESENKYNHFFSFYYVTKNVRNFTEISKLYEIIMN